MLSLLRNSNRSSSGAVFLDESVNINPQRSLRYYQLETTTSALVPLILGLCLEITGIIFVFVWPKIQTNCNTYFIFLSLHCVYWLIIWMTHRLIKEEHSSLLMAGYIEFYKKTKQLRKIPYFIASFWLVFYLCLFMVLQYMHNIEEYCRVSGWFTPLNCVLLLTTLELLIIVPVYACYIRKVAMFNRQHLEARFMASCGLPVTSPDGLPTTIYW